MISLFKAPTLAPLLKNPIHAMLVLVPCFGCCGRPGNQDVAAERAPNSIPICYQRRERSGFTYRRDPLFRGLLCNMIYEIRNLNNFHKEPMRSSCRVAAHQRFGICRSDGFSILSVWWLPPLKCQWTEPTNGWRHTIADRPFRM